MEMVVRRALLFPQYGVVVVVRIFCGVWRSTRRSTEYFVLTTYCVVRKGPGRHTSLQASNREANREAGGLRQRLRLLY